MNRPSVLAPSEGAAPARFSADEFLRMAELGAFAGMKVELDQGEIVRMNPPHTGHAVVQANVLRKLFEAVLDDRVVVLPEIAVQLGTGTVRALDAALVRASGLGDKILAPADVILAVEVSDATLQQDLGVKLADYGAAGIALYWVVDVNAKVTHVMSGPDENGYRERKVVRFGEVLDLPERLGSITLG